MPSQPIHCSGGQSMSQRTPAEKFVRRSSLLLIALFAIAVFSFKTIHQTAQAQTAGGTRLLRTPTVSATQIAFAYAQNIWTVPRAGGMARRITSFQGQTSNPHFSPDGKWIAFSGEYAGNLDVYVVPADGGEPKRLTWHPGADLVQGWTADGKSIMFSSTRATWSPSGAPRFWTVPAAGGVEEPMALPRGYQGKISADGSHIAYRMNNSWDDERRNYRGGQNRPIWIVDLKTYDLVSPPWTGRRVAVEARGEIVNIPAEKGDVRNLSNSSASAERDPAWSPDGKWISYFSDRSGEYRLYIETQDGLTPPREIVLDHPTHFYTPSWSPDSKKLVFTDTGLHVWVLDVASGKAKVVGNDPWMVPQRTLNPVWSPDSKWVAYSSRLRSMYHAIFVSNAETGETKQVTDGLADAVWPAWDANGKYLWFLASTDFGLRSQWLDMTSYDHDETFGLYLVVLKKSDASPLLPESDEDRGVGTGRRSLPPGACAGDVPAGGTDATSGEQQTQAPRGPRQPVTVQVDFDGLPKRIISVPGVPERQYSALHSSTDGIVFYLQAPARGQGGGGPGGGGGGSELIRYRLCDRRASTFVNSVSDFDVSADGRKLVYRAATGGGGGGPAAFGGRPPAPSLFIVDSD